MDAKGSWNTIIARVIAIAIGIIVIWLGLQATKPFGYVLEAIGAVIIIAAVININRVGRQPR